MNKNNEFLTKWAEMEGANPTDKFPELSAVLPPSNQHVAAPGTESSEESKRLLKIEQYKELSWSEMDKKGVLEDLKKTDFKLFKDKFKEEFGTEYTRPQYDETYKTSPNLSLPNQPVSNLSKEQKQADYDYAVKQLKIEQYKELSWSEMDKKGMLEDLKKTDLNLFKVKFKEEFGTDYSSK